MSNVILQVITTVGTSWLGNALRDDAGQRSNMMHATRRAASSEQSGSSLWKQLDRISNEYFSITHPDGAAEVSAEINSIDKIYRQYRRADQPMCVHLLATDTVASYYCATRVAVWFAHFANIYPQLTITEVSTRNTVVKDLRIDPVATFRDHGVQELILWVLDRIYTKKEKVNDSYTRNPGEFLINFSGGYKAMIPLLSLLGQLEGVPSLYVYESSEELLEMPAVPVGFNEEFLQEYSPLLDEYILSDRNAQNIRRAVTSSLSELEKARLIKAIGSTSTTLYKLTPMGQLMRLWAHRHTPYSKKTALSFIMEYKLLEYLKDANKQIAVGFTASYHTVERSLELESARLGKRSEIDLHFMGPVGEGYAVGEVKSTGKIMGKGLNKTLNQLKQRHFPLLYEHFGSYPQTYCLMLYQMYGAVRGDNEYVKQQLDQVKAAVHIFSPATQVVVLLYTVPNPPKGALIYQRVLQEALDVTHLQTIQLD